MPLLDLRAPRSRLNLALRAKTQRSDTRLVILDELAEPRKDCRAIVANTVMLECIGHMWPQIPVAVGCRHRVLERYEYVVEINRGCRSRSVGKQMRGIIR